VVGRIKDEVNQISKKLSLSTIGGRIIKAKIIVITII
jgi:hypothetical protein